jgi:hypothetical protein
MRAASLGFLLISNAVITSEMDLKGRLQRNREAIEFALGSPE